MSVVWAKIRRDLGQNKARTTLVVLSIAVGVFALGFIYGAHDMQLSYPAARLFGRVVGDTLLSADLYFRYSVTGTLAWLVIIIVVAVLASLWPALQATRVSVREALAYE